MFDSSNVWLPLPINSSGNDYLLYQVNGNGMMTIIGKLSSNMIGNLTLPDGYAFAQSGGVMITTIPNWVNAGATSMYITLGSDNIGVNATFPVTKTN